MMKKYVPSVPQTSLTLLPTLFGSSTALPPQMKINKTTQQTSKESLRHLVPPTQAPSGSAHPLCLGDSVTLPTEHLI